MNIARITFLVAAAGVLAVLSPRAASAGAGDLDQAFGDGGIASIELGAGGDRASALALQDDGKIVVTGRMPNDDLVIVRFNADGSVDKTFSEDGFFSTDRISEGSDVINAGGKITAVGGGDEHLVQLNSDGTLDSEFGPGDDGFTGSQFFNPEDPEETYPPDMNRLIRNPDGSIIVAGTIDYGPYFYTFARYGSDGSLDKSFGDDGQVQTDFSPPEDGFDQEPLALVRYSNDRFLAAGYRDVADDTPEASVIAVYNEAGKLDESFGDDGKTTSDFIQDDGKFGSEAIREVFPMEDGRILVAGSGQVEIGDTSGGREVPFLAMYDPDGTSHSAFGDDGVITYELEDSYTVEGAALTEDGSIILVGDHELTSAHMAYVARINPDGTPDSSFGDNGWLDIDLGAGASRADVLDLVIDENGDLLLAGAITIGGEPRLGVIKLNGSAGTPRTFGDINCNGNADSVDALAIQRDLAALPVNQTQPCPGIGDLVDVAAASERFWGDMDCDDDVDSVDSLKLLRSVAALPVQQEPGCPAIGSPVHVSEVRRASD